MRVASWLVIAVVCVVGCGSQTPTPGLGAAGASAGTGSAGLGGSGSGGSSPDAGMLATAGSGGSGTGAAGTGAGSGAAGTGAATTACTTYPSTTIATMRQPAAPGCYELTHVGLVARTDSPTEPRVYLQDKNGTDFSAIMAKCSATAMHACPAAVAAKIPQLFDTLAEAAQVTVRGYYQYTKADGFEQFYIEDLIDDGTKLARPAPISLTVANIMRDARLPAKWFQRANVAIPVQDPLVMYDFSPADLALTQSTACPALAGFGMIPMSAAKPAATACTGTTAPAARATDPSEVLIGRQFFKQFLFSTDCACSAGTGQLMLTGTEKVSGTVLGYLTLEKDKGTTAPYQVFEAAADKTFPLK